MSKEPVYEIVRSFSKTVQVKQFQPESNFCSVKESFYEMPSEEGKLKKSKELYEFARLEVLKAVYPKTMTVEEFESLSPREQADLQDIKKAKGREEYKANKEKQNREKCPTCNVYRYIGEECVACNTETVGDRTNQREVSELRGGDGSE